MDPGRKEQTCRQSSGCVSDVCLKCKIHARGRPHIHTLRQGRQPSPFKWRDELNQTTGRCRPVSPLENRLVCCQPIAYPCPTCSNARGHLWISTGKHVREHPPSTMKTNDHSFLSAKQTRAYRPGIGYDLWQVGQKQSSAGASMIPSRSKGRCVADPSLW